MFGKKKTATPDFDEKIKAAKYERIYQSLKDILKIEKIYPCIFVDSYVIMPNHIHLLLTIDTIRRPMVAPTIATVIKQFKGAVSKEVGMSVWQKGFYDHIIRDDEDYNTKAQYIDTNPLTWERDELYTER